MSWLPIFGLISAVLIPAVSSRCLASDVVQCQVSSGLKPYLLTIGIDIDDPARREDSWPFTLTRAQLTMYCSKNTLYEACLEREVVGCDDATDLIIETANVQANFICQVTFEEFLTQHQACLAGVQVRDDIATCNAEYTARIQSATSIAQVCSLVDLGTDCATDAVGDRCDAATADWYERLIDATNKPFNDDQCSGAESRFSFNFQVLAALIVAALLL